MAENHCSRPRATQGPESSDTSVRMAASHSTQPHTPRSFWKVDDSRLYKSGSRMSLQVGCSDVGFGPTTESSTMEKSDVTLSALRSLFLRRGWGPQVTQRVLEGGTPERARDANDACEEEVLEAPRLLPETRCAFSEASADAGMAQWHTA